MAHPETPPPSPISLVSTDVDQLKHHGLLRQLINAQVTEELLDADALEPEAMKLAMQGYRKRNSLASAEQLQKHCRRFGYSQEDLQWQEQWNAATVADFAFSGATTDAQRYVVLGTSDQLERPPRDLAAHTFEVRTCDAVGAAPEKDGGTTAAPPGNRVTLGRVGTASGPLASDMYWVGAA